MKQYFVDFLIFILSLAAFIYLVCWFPTNDDNFSEWEASRQEKGRLQHFNKDNDDNTNHNEDVLEHAKSQDDDEYYTAEIDCYACSKKPGACPFCFGNQKLQNPVTFATTPCPFCKASGKCNVCHGSGKLSAEYKKNVSEEERRLSTEQLNRLYQIIKDETDSQIRQSQEVYDAIINPSRRECPYCHGLGYEQKYMFCAEIYEKTWCENCHKYDYIHTDVICPICNNRN